MIEIILIIEVWLIWAFVFKRNKMYDCLDGIYFYLLVVGIIICYITLNRSGVITQTKSNGEIIKQIIIGE